MNEQNQQYRGKNNPTKDYDISPMPEIRKTARGYVKTKSSKEDGRRAASAAALKAAEDSASSEPDSGDTKTREGEPKTSTFTSTFVSKVTGNKKKSGFTVKVKKYRTVIFILGLLGLGGGGILASQSMLGYNLVSRMLDEANPQFISNHLRSPTIFRYAVEKNKFTKEQKEDFKKHGIEIVEKKGKKTKVRYIDEQGKTRTVTVKKAMKDDAFRIKYNAASQEYAGQYAGQHDSIAIKLRKILGISYDNWHGWRNDTKDDDPQTKRKKFRDIMKEKVVSKYGGETSRVKGEEDDGKENGELNKDQSRAKIREKLSDVVGGISGGIAFGTCGYFAINTALNAYTMGISITNSFAVASTLLEAIQKSQAGDGTESPIHEALNSITEIDPETGTSALQSTGLGDLFSGGTGKTNGDIPGNIEQLFVVGERTVANFSTCAMASTVNSVITLFVPMGKGVKASKVILKSIAKFGGNAMLAVFAEKAIQSYIDNATDAIKREFDMANSLAGETYGTNLYNGGTEILGRTAQVGGASYLNVDMVEQYQKGKQAALNDQADYERATKSPFDTSSQYTFLGSLVNNSLFPLATSVSTSSIGSILSQSSAILSNSVTSILPSASAIGATHAVTIQGECPVSNTAADAAGNRNCISYRGTDTSTINDDCDQECVIRYIMKHYPDAFEETEFTLTPTIKEKSNLWRYQKYCGLRGSQVGLFDADITSQIDEENGVTELAAKISNNTFLSLIPVVGELADIVKNIQESSKSEWITGEACVAGNKHWNEYKWYQRFLEDQRLMANMGIIDQSSGEQLITAYLEGIDNSQEAVIARLSGLSKDTVIAIEDEMFYESYLANDYDPENLGPLYHENIEAPINLAIHTPTSNLNNAEAIALERIVYAPLQARAQSMI